jgi:hypothetical protein
LGIGEDSAANRLVVLFSSYGSCVFIFFACSKKTEPKERAPGSLAALRAVPCAPQYFARSLNSLRSDNAHSFAKSLRCSARDDGNVSQKQNTYFASFRRMPESSGFNNIKALTRRTGFAFDLRPFDAAEHRSLHWVKRILV